jgi:hypothetical protein
MWDRLAHWWRDRGAGMCPDCGMDFADARRMAKLAEVDDDVALAAARLLRATTADELDDARADLQAAIDLRRAAQEATKGRGL